MFCCWSVTFLFLSPYGTYVLFANVVECFFCFSAPSTEVATFKTSQNGVSKCVNGEVSCVCDNQIYNNLEDRQKCDEEISQYHLKELFEMMSIEKKKADEQLYASIKYHGRDIYYKIEDELIEVHTHSGRDRVSKYKFPTNPSRGFEIWKHSRGDLVGIFAFLDDDEQKAKLIVRLLKRYKVKYENVTLLENLNREAFSNFGHKIVLITFSDYRYKALLVSSPTSSWLDLPAVGHVEIFVHGKYTIFSKDSIYVRGNPVAFSYFGFNVEQVKDLNRDWIDGKRIE
ncbi:hypothetical protein RF11_12531 [Thelohanellus kitauei]|uniref:Uncharacterized protein n=1 Tax=Thelohanellus kitauei TaxID=669202 RepID=A0A0C2M2H8_THEKT|nr:hypothetical protein RF11_12531 [Thelohanellus kitauei]